MEPFIAQSVPVTNVDLVSLIPLIGPANRAVAHYDGLLYGIRNPHVLLSPLTTQEAVLSSRIEGTQATLGEVLKYEAGEEPAQESRRQDIQEIINYRHALRRAQEILKTKPFHLNLLLELHAILLNSVRGRDKERGRFRTKQNWIGPPDCPIEQARFVPPEPMSVPGLLDNWEKYYHREEPDVLVQLAVLHAQFEIIHPFVDGNGRIGRLLLPLFLYERRLLSKPMFYLSAYFERHRDEYYERLRPLGASQDAWNQWIAFFLKAVCEQADENTKKARQILDLYERLKDRVRELTHSQFAVPLLDRLFDQPIVQTTELARHRSMPSRPMVMVLLGKLRAAGILKTVRPGSGRRAEVLALAELINLCEGRKVF